MTYEGYTVIDTSRVSIYSLTRKGIPSIVTYVLSLLYLPFFNSKKPPL